MPPTRIRLGILTPSSNTALEPLTYALLSSLNASNPTYQISAHFSRFPVTSISLSPTGLAQFDLEPILQAADLLTHADVDVIGWSGTSSGWLGFERDEELCREIERRTGGVRATTSVLGLNRALRLCLGVKRLGLVTPYMDDVQQLIISNYQSVGIEIGAGMERHLRIERNTDIAEIGEDVLDGMVEEVVRGGVEAVSTFCTNLVAAQRVDYWERKHGIPVLDTVTIVVWDMLRVLGVEAKGVEGWGMIWTR